MKPRYCAICGSREHNASWHAPRALLASLTLLSACGLGPADACHDACDEWVKKCDDHKADHCVLPTTTGAFELNKVCSFTAAQSCLAHCKQRNPDNAVACVMTFVSCDEITGIEGKCFEP